MSEPAIRTGIDQTLFRRVLSHHPTGVSVVTATGNDGERVGMVVGSFASVSLDPPLVAFMPARTSSTYARLRSVSHFCVNVLAADQQSVAARFASRTQDKFAGLEATPTGTGGWILDGALAWVDCSVHDVVEAGDHDIVLGRVERLEVSGSTTPLVFFQGAYGGFSPQSVLAPYLRDPRSEAAAWGWA
jgi:flavin reductase (DIM6/NTAB) family NADH-FMN oxidoreductase RutF